MNEARPRGRPRDADIDAKVLAAARALLEDVGFAGTTIQAVAQRAGVNPPAVYRRWPNRIRLIEECVFPGLDEVDVRPTGDLDADLRRFEAAYQAAFAVTSLRHALPGLIAAYQLDPESRLAAQQSNGNARPLFHAILAAAPASAIDPALDPDDLFDLMIGAVLCRIVMTSMGVRANAPDRTVDLLLRTMRPAANGP